MFVLCSYHAVLCWSRVGNRPRKWPKFIYPIRYPIGILTEMMNKEPAINAAISAPRLGDQFRLPCGGV